MKISKPLIVFSFFFVLVLALLFYFLTTPQSQLPPSYRFAASVPPSKPSFPQEESLQTLKERELLDLEPDSAPAAIALIPGSNTTRGNLDVPAKPSFSTQQPLVPPTDSQLDLNPLKTPSSAVHSSPRTLGSQNMAQTPSSGPYARATRPHTPSAIHLQQSRQQAREEYDSQVQQETRERVFNSYLPKISRDQEKKIQNQLKGFSASLNRAIAKAVTPKGKKTANIEKYMRRREGTEAAPVASGPFSAVVQQVADQKSGIVNTMTDTYGASAGKQAGQLMDSFKQEMQSAVNAPNQTPKQVAEKTKLINDKYQHKLQKMGQEEGAKKFETERLKRDAALKAQIAAKYDEKIAKEAALKIDATREKDLALIKQNLPEKEYYAQTLANQRELDDDLKKVILDNGKSLEPLQQAREELVGKEIEQETAKQERGEISSARWVPTENLVVETQKSLQAESQQKLKQIEQIYGPQAAQQAKELYADYQKRYIAALKSGQDRVSINKKLQSEVKEINKNMAAFVQKPEVKEAGIKQSTQDSMQKMMDSDEIKKWPDESKKVLQKQAQPILEQMYREAAEVNASTIKPEEKQRQLEQIEKNAQEKLGKIQVPQPDVKR